MPAPPPQPGPAQPGRPLRPPAAPLRPGSPATPANRPSAAAPEATRGTPPTRSTPSGETRGATPPPSRPDRAAPTTARRAPAAADRADAQDVRRVDETRTRRTAADAGVAPAPTDSDAPRPTRAPPAGRLPSVARNLVAVVAVLVFAVTAFQYVGKARLDAAVRQVTALDPESGAIVDAEGQAGDENVLLLGSEATRGDRAGGGPRTDTVLLAHVPSGGGEVVGMSIPYNLEVNRPPCRRWDAAAGVYLEETVPAEARTPLISAFDLGGPQCATRVVQQLTGLAVTRFVGLDLDGVGDLVDAVGGVDVCVGRPVIDSVLGAVLPVAGTSTLDGRRARDLVRARAVEGDTLPDVPQRQQRLLAALLDKVLSPQVLLDPGRTGAIGPALGGSLTLDAADLDRVLATASSLRDFAADGVTFTTVPIADRTSGTGNTLLRPAEAADLFAALRNGEPLPEQTVLAAAGGVSPADVTADAPVQILNASDRQGLAGRIAETLGGLGVEVGEVGNAPTPTEQTLIRFSPDRAAAAALLAEMVPAASSMPDRGASGLFQLVLGRSFDDVVRAPTAASTSAAAITDGPAAPC